MFVPAGREMQVKDGEIIAGKYRIERVLGEGGMGFVVQAMHVQLDERVAIKFLLPQALANEEAVARFAREARAAVKIKSEHVARVSDVGTLETGAPYMVMEFLQGQDLAALVRAQGALPTADAVDYLLQASEAIAEAHALGIVHRDLKPANLFLVHRADGSPCIKVLDFGISKMTSTGSSGSDLGMTRTHAIMGSPLYMSPEQFASTRDVDARADIWALGAILYELVTGRVPFEADTMPQLCGMILQEPVPAPRSLRAELPDGLEIAILRCLEKDRSKRFQNLSEVAAALVPFAPRGSLRSAQRISRVLSAAGLPSSSVPTSPSTPPAASDGVSVTQGAFGKTLAQGGGRAMWLVSALLLVVASGALLALWMRSRAEPSVGNMLASSASLPVRPAATPPRPAPKLVQHEEPAPPTPLPSASVAPPGSASSALTATPSAPPAVARRAAPAPRAKPVVAPRAAATPAEAAGSALDPLQGRR
jgi:serine/threonine-protein kinase